MINLFIPNMHINHIRDIDLTALKAEGIKAIISDLDNTLVAPMEDHIDDEIISIFKNIEEDGFQFAIITNSGELRMQKYIGDNKVKYIASAKKPLKGGFLKALEVLNLPAAEVAIVGDQLLTDIFGGNRQGLYTILVNPFAKKEKVQTYINRFFEKKLINYMYKRGLILWHR